VQSSPLSPSNRVESEGGRGSFSWCNVIALFSTCPQLCDRPRRTKDSPGAQLHPGSRGRLYVQVEEKIEFFTLWHFYGGNGAMARWMSRWWNFSMMAKTLFGGFCVLH